MGSLKKHNAILLVINVISSVLLTILYFCIEKSPENNYFFATIPFIYSFLFIINVLFIFYWIFTKRILIIFSLLAIVITFKFVTLIVPISSYLSFQNKDTTSLKIMSYNVNVFGLYNWHDLTIKHNILKVIATENPDILCLQEAFWSENSNNFVTIDSIKILLNAKYVFKHALTTAVAKQSFGLVVVSKYPIVNKFSQKFEDSQNGFIYADIVKDNDTIRIYNCHLQSVHLGKDDYFVLDSLTDAENKNLKSYGKVLKKYLYSCKARAKQADIVSKDIDSCKYSKFICGDLNDIPISYSYFKIRNNLTDSFSKRGRFSDFTWNYNKLKLRIDYIFYDVNYKCKSHKTLKNNYSDHYAVVVEFSKLKEDS